MDGQAITEGTVNATGDMIFVDGAPRSSTRRPSIGERLFLIARHSLKWPIPSILREHLESLETEIVIGVLEGSPGISVRQLLGIRPYGRSEFPISHKEEIGRHRAFDRVSGTTERPESSETI